jgi:histidinol-phosphate aminotransferase
MRSAPVRPVPDFSALAQPGIRGLRAYDPGHDLVDLRDRFGEILVELGSNENSFGCSPRASEAIAATVPLLHRYPDPRGADLKHALAELHDVAPESILLGNGSHELLMQFAQVFAGPGQSVVASQFGFAVYAIAAQAAGARFVAAPALPDDDAMPRGHDLDAMRAAVDADTRLVFVCNPNNPTGTSVPRQALQDFIGQLASDVITVVDEAYQEYVVDPALGSVLPLVATHPQLVVARTFSKAYGLAGLRCGYAIAHPTLVAVIERVRESFNVNLLALAAAEAALDDQAHVADVRERTAAERAWLAAALAERGCRVFPSQTNFLLVRFGVDAPATEARLLSAGVVVRPMAGYGLGDCLRITVGRRSENARLLAVLDSR